MKKLMVFVILGMILMLSGCSRTSELSLADLDGRLYYQECVYLNFLSSASIDYFEGLHSDVSYIEFSDGQVIFLGSDDILRTYENVQFVEKDLDSNMDAVLSYGIDDLLSDFILRYDIYSDDESIGVTIFFGESEMYLAETRMLGEDNDILTIWDVFIIE